MRPVALFLAIVAISLSSCGGQPPAPTTADSTPALSYTETEGGAAEQVEEVIRMNNCGGRGDVKQTAERSLTVEVEGEASLGVDIRVVRADLAGRYAESRGVSKSMEITAPPGTNMEYTLVWTEQSWFGTVTSSVGSAPAKYRARVPIAVDLRSSRDVGDCAGGQVPTTQPEAQPLTPEPPTLPTPPAPPTMMPTTPPPTPIPTTPPPTPITPTTDGTILRDGETWYTDNGWSLTVQNFTYNTFQEGVRLTLRNLTGRQVLFPTEPLSAQMIADTGEKSECGLFYIQDGNSFDMRPGGKIVWDVRFFDPNYYGGPCGGDGNVWDYSSETRTITLAISSIGDVIMGATWQAEIPRP